MRKALETSPVRGDHLLKRLLVVSHGHGRVPQPPSGIMCRFPSQDPKEALRRAEQADRLAFRRDLQETLTLRAEPCGKSTSMDPAQQGGRRVPASFLLSAGSKRPDTLNDRPANGGSGGAVKAHGASALAFPQGSNALALPPGEAAKQQQGTEELPGQGDGASGSTAPVAKPPGPRKLPGSFAAQAARAPAAAGNSTAPRPPALNNPEDTQVSMP